MQQLETVEEEQGFPAFFYPGRRLMVFSIILI